MGYFSIQIHCFHDRIGVLMSVYIWLTKPASCKKSLTSWHFCRQVQLNCTGLYRHIFFYYFINPISIYLHFITCVFLHQILLVSCLCSDSQWVCIHFLRPFSHSPSLSQPTQSSAWLSFHTTTALLFKSHNKGPKQTFRLRKRQDETLKNTVFRFIDCWGWHDVLKNDGCIYPWQIFVWMLWPSLSVLVESWEADIQHSQNYSRSWTVLYFFSSTYTGWIPF